MNYFVFNERLGIELPVLDRDWNGFDEAEQAAIIEKWELIRGAIPDRIFGIEAQINKKQAQLFEEENFEASCALNADIAELASRINDLQIWYRINQEIEARSHYE